MRFFCVCLLQINALKKSTFASPYDSTLNASASQKQPASDIQVAFALLRTIAFRGLTGLEK